MPFNSICAELWQFGSAVSHHAERAHRKLHDTCRGAVVSDDGRRVRLSARLLKCKDGDVHLRSVTRPVEINAPLLQDTDCPARRRQHDERGNDRRIQHKLASLSSASDSAHSVDWNQASTKTLNLSRSTSHTCSGAALG